MILTNRLIIIPLTPQQLKKYVQCDNSLERELGLKDTTRTISCDLKEALESTILPNVADKNKNYLYSTLWTAILKSENSMIGELCMMGEPNTKGEVEIGYGIYPEYQNNGLMTEFVAGIIGWLKNQPEVKSILASTNKANISSFRVLEKNMFAQISKSDDLINWQLILNTNGLK